MQRHIGVSCFEMRTPGSRKIRRLVFVPRCNWLHSPGMRLLDYTNILDIVRREKDAPNHNPVPQTCEALSRNSTPRGFWGLRPTGGTEDKIQYVSWLGALAKIRTCIPGCWQKEEKIQGEERHPYLSPNPCLSAHISYDPPSAYKATLVACLSVSSAPRSFLPQGLCICSSGLLPRRLFLQLFPSHSSSLKTSINFSEKSNLPISLLICVFYLLAHSLALLNRDSCSLCCTGDSHSARLLLDTQ